MSKLEEQLQMQLADWMLLKHPWAMFRSDGGGLRLPIGLAVKYKRLNGGRKSWPDFFVAEPVGECKGLFIEIKTRFEDVYTKNGDIRTSEHIKEQHKTLLKLRNRGYYAVFGCGFENCVDIITNYLKCKRL